MGNSNSHSKRRNHDSGSGSAAAAGRMTGNDVNSLSASIGNLFGSVQAPNVDQLIRTGQLAPRTVVDDTGASGQDAGVECPICFNNYFGLNSMTCCGQTVCTECYVSLKASSDEVRCPYCDVVAFEVKYSVRPSCGAGAGTARSEGPRATTTAAAVPPPPAATHQVVVTNSVADRRELEAQIARQRDADRHGAQSHRQTLGPASGSGSGGGGGSRVSSGLRGPSTNLPDDLLSISDYMRFYAEMRADGEPGTAQQPGAPQCPECGAPTRISAHTEGGYSNGLFICNLCQSTRQCSDSRWCCRLCSADICFRCRQSHRADLPSDPSPVPSQYESGGNLRGGSAASHSLGSGGRSRQRLYASRSSQQSGLLASMQQQSALTGGSGSGSGAAAAAQWEQESDLLEEMMLLEAIQLSLQTSETGASADAGGATETAVELPAVPEGEIAPEGAAVDATESASAPKEPAS